MMYHWDRSYLDECYSFACFLGGKFCKNSLDSTLFFFNLHSYPLLTDLFPSTFFSAMSFAIKFSLANSLSCRHMHICFIWWDMKLFEHNLFTWFINGKCRTVGLFLDIKNWMPNVLFLRCCTGCGKVVDNDNFSTDPVFVKNADGQVICIFVFLLRYFVETNHKLQTCFCFVFTMT